MMGHQLEVCLHGSGVTLGVANDHNQRKLRFPLSVMFAIRSPNYRACRTYSHAKETSGASDVHSELYACFLFILKTF